MKALNKSIQKFTLPLIASNIMQIIISQISLSFISRKSIESMAAVTTIESLLYSLGGILGVISLSFNIFGARALGEKKENEFRTYVSSVFSLSFIIGVCFLLISLAFGETILSILYGFEGEMLHDATTYLNIMSPYILFTLLTFVCTNLLKVEKKTEYIFGVSTFAALIQVFLNYIFVNGKLGVKPLGVQGTGLAGIISLGFILMVYLIILRKMLVSSLKVSPVRMSFLIRKSIPLMIQESFEGMFFILSVEMMIARMGLTTLSIYSLVTQVLILAKLPTLMYGNAVTVFASEAYGKGDNNQIKVVEKISLLSSLCWYISVVLLCVVIRDRVFLLFTNDSNILESLPEAFPIMVLASLATPLYEICKYVAQSMDFGLRVCFFTGIVNVLIIGVMIVLYTISILNFTSIFLLYGLNYLALGLLFMSYVNKKMKERYQPSI